jgi:hypothetical protein
MVFLQTHHHAIIILWVERTDRHAIIILWVGHAHRHAIMILWLEVVSWTCTSSCHHPEMSTNTAFTHALQHGSHAHLFNTARTHASWTRLSRTLFNTAGAAVVRWYFYRHIVIRSSMIHHPVNWTDRSSCYHHLVTRSCELDIHILMRSACELDMHIVMRSSSRDSKLWVGHAHRHAIISLWVYAPQTKIWEW